MKNPLLHQGRVHVVTRHGRWLSPAAAELLRRIVADMDRFTASRQDATQAARA
jgi:hypothetical protein